MKKNLDKRIRNWQSIDYIVHFAKGKYFERNARKAVNLKSYGSMIVRPPKRIFLYIRIVYRVMPGKCLAFILETTFRKEVSTMKKKILSLIIAVVMIATYIPNVSAAPGGNGNGNRNTKINVHIIGGAELVNTRATPAGNMYFDESGFKAGFNTASYPGIQEITENPVGSKFTATHSIPLKDYNNNLLKWSDSSGYVRDAITGLSLNVADGEDGYKTVFLYQRRTENWRRSSRFTKYLVKCSAAS